MFPPQLIVAGRIAGNLDIGSKKRLLEALSELLAQGDHTLNQETIFERLLERERLGSTGLGYGIALPHARIKEIDAAIGAFVQLREGVDFDAADAEPVDLAFGLLVPESANEAHLQLLADLAGRFSDADLRRRLREADDADTMLALISAPQAEPPGP